MYEYIIETETPLSELETSLTAKKLEPSARLEEKEDLRKNKDNLGRKSDD